MLDFGIAKLLAEAEAEDSAAFPLTRTGMRLLTPAYAAPELYDPTASVTTAADVYGLGALLYEVLTGARPHADTADASGAAPVGEPTRPSRVVVPAPGGTAPEAARRPSQALVGDLDTICLKALHLDPARRYGSAAELADDLERHLEGRPVEARRDSLAYVAGRFAQRHRGAVGASAVAVVALVVGLAFSLVSLASEREAVAEAQAARVEAELSAERANEAADLLAGMFQTASPDYDEGREMTTREALDEGVVRVGSLESPSLRAYLNRVLAETYIHIGDPRIADSLLQASLDLVGRDATSEEASRLRRLLMSTRDAMADYEGVLGLGERLYRDHRDDEDQDRAFTALVWMSRAHSNLGHHREAIAIAERARAMLPPEASAKQRAKVSSRLGEALFLAGQVEASIPHLEEALRLTVAEVGRRNSRTTQALTSLGRARGHLGQIEKAEVLLREAIAFDTERYGEDRVAYPLAYLGEAKLYAGQFRQAAAVFDSALTVGAALYPANHPDIGEWHALRAEACNGYGAFRDAERAARRALTIADSHGDGAATERASRLLAVALRAQGRASDTSG